MNAIWPGTEHLLPESAVAELASLTEENDRRGRLSDRSIEILREAGYFGLPVPSDLSGGNASLVECCAIQRRLGAADPGLSIGVNMHIFSMGFMVEHWKRHHDESGQLLEQIARQGQIVVSAFAEPGLGGSLTRSNCTARRVGDDWLTSGLKVPCSLAERSDLLCLQMIDEAGGPESLLVGLVPTGAPGIKVERTWNTLGMRASESDTIKLTDCPVPDDMIVHRSSPGSLGDEVFAAGTGWFCVTSTAAYLGVASAAIDHARSALTRSRITHLNASRAELPSFQNALGEILTSVMTMEAACAQLARLLDEGKTDARSLLPAMLALKYQAAEKAIHAVEMTAELVGVASYSANGPVTRLIRDVHAARFHPPTNFVTRQLLGRWALGLPWNFDLSEVPVGQ
ncbi:acyl-CoA dehydrogenase [Nocardia panacis]|uniref:Dibenzothiophene monooxygenase n=1 Tax=Nocardia panacis TaxID=2340916 RepID=A0A3A4K9U5_9NOCA|nr:acyl-CoA dehydrogenase [Nocardia panacis]